MNYGLLDRYLVTFTLRDDGSSRFSKDHRWGLFPSAAFAWRINEENFLKNAKNVSDAKLRLGWGITGQQEGIGDYTYFSNFTVSGSGAYYPITGTGITYRPEGYNPELTWEKTTTYNVGLDLGFFKNRFTASVDYYYRKTIRALKPNLSIAPSRRRIGIGKSDTTSRGTRTKLMSSFPPMALL